MTRLRDMIQNLINQLYWQLYEARNTVGQYENKISVGEAARFRDKSTGFQSEGPGFPGSSAFGSRMPLGKSSDTCPTFLIFE